MSDEATDFPPPHSSQQAIDAEFAQLMADMGDLEEQLVEAVAPDQPLEKQPQVSQRQAIALYLLPVSSAEALSALLSMSGIQLQVIPSEAGALVVEELQLEETGWAVSLVQESLREFHPQVSAVAAGLSRLSRLPVVVLTALLAPGNEVEPDVTGRVLAGRWAGGEYDVDLPAGLVMAQMPVVIEDLLLGRVTPQEVASTVQPEGLSKWQSLRILGKSLRTQRRGEES